MKRKKQNTWNEHIDDWKGRWCQMELTGAKKKKKKEEDNE